MASDPKTKTETFIAGLCGECSQFEFSSHENWEPTIKNETLIQCAGKGHLECVKACLEAGADVNSTQESYPHYTAVMLAAYEGHLDCVKALIQSGADLNKQVDDDYTALMIAAEEGNVDCLKTLIEAGADVNYSDCPALIKASRNGHVDCVKTLIQSGTNLDSSISETVLICAARSGHVDCVKLLVDAGADVNKQDEYGWTALMEAIEETNECIAILLEAGADVNLQDKCGRTALFCTRIAIAKSLLRAGARVNIVEQDGLNALMYNLTHFGRNKKLHILLFAAGETVDETKVKVPDYLKHEGLKLNLKHSCRETIRKHLINIDPHKHLFSRIPQLGLPSSLEKYLLYNVSLDDEDDDDDGLR